MSSTVSPLSPTFVTNVKQLDDLSKAVIESHTRLYDTYIKGNDNLSYQDIVMLRAKHERAMSAFGASERTKYIYLVANDVEQIYRFTILDNEFITSIHSNVFNWDEQQDSYQIVKDVYSAFIVDNPSEYELKLVGGFYLGKILKKDVIDYRLDPEEAIMDAIDNERLHEIVGAGSIVYPMGLNLKYSRSQYFYSDDFGDLSYLLYVMAKFGYWNMATLHMMEYNPLSDLSSSEYPFVHRAITGLKDGEFRFTYGSEFPITYIVGTYDGTVEMFDKAGHALNLISSDELEVVETKKRYYLEEHNTENLLKNMLNLGMEFIVQ